MGVTLGVPLKASVEGCVEGASVEECGINRKNLTIYTLFLFSLNNFIFRVDALGGTKFAYLCGHIT